MATEMSRRERLIQLGQEANHAWVAGAGRDNEDRVTWITDAVVIAVDAEYAPLLEAMERYYAAMSDVGLDRGVSVAEYRRLYKDVRHQYYALRAAREES